MKKVPVALPNISTNKKTGQSILLLSVMHNSKGTIKKMRHRGTLFINALYFKSQIYEHRFAAEGILNPATGKDCNFVKL